MTRRVVYLGAFATAALGAACSFVFPLDVFQSGSAGPQAIDDAGDANVHVPGCALKHPPPKPAADDEGGPDISIVFAARTTSLTSDSGIPAGDYGYDLDEYCTGQDADTPSCTPPAKAPDSRDGDGGVDNAAAAVVQAGQVLGGNFLVGDFERYVNEGTSTLLIQVTGYNGMPNDSQVVVGIMGADYRMGDGKTPSDRAPPNWDGKDVWSLMETTLQPNGQLPRSIDQTAYVSGGVLVTKIGSLSDAGASGVSSLVGLANNITDGYLTGSIVKENDIWQLHDGVLAGRLPVDSIFALLSSDPTVCKGTLKYVAARELLCKRVDVMANPETDGHDLPCDAVSFGLGLEATQAQRGVLGIHPPIEAGCGENYTNSCGQ